MKKQVTTLAVMMLASNVAMANLSQQSINLSADSLQSMSKAAQVLGAGSANFVSGGAELSKNALLATIGAAGKIANSTSNAVSEGAEIVADKTVSAAKGASNLAGKAADSTSQAVESTGKAVSKGAKSASDKVVSAASTVKNAASKAADSTSDAVSAAAEFTVEKVESAAQGSYNVTKVTLKAIGNGAVIVGTFSYNSASNVGQAMIDSAGKLFKAGSKVIVATSTAGVVLVTDSANGVERVLDGQIKAGSSTIVTSVSHASKSFKSKLVE
jgi:hypothetical protein